jgi:hypothetical protein
MLIVVLSLPTAALAQTEASGPRPPGRAVMSGGLGTGTRDVALMLAFSVGGARREILARWAAVSDFEIFAPATLTQDVAVLAALRRERPHSWSRVALGIGHVRSRTDGCHPECSGSSTVGLAWQTDIAFAPVRVLGLGAQLFGNVNTVDTFMGVALNVHLGTMR